MPIKILMPALSPTMTEGTLAKWLKAEGDTVSAGDIIAEIETDKATMEVEVVDEGVLARVVVPEGTEGVQVNQVIAILLEEGEDAAALDSVKIDAPPPPAAAPEEAPAEAPPRPVTAAPPSTEVPQSGEGKVAASPLARRMARQAGLDLAAVPGSGPHGRIVKADIDAALAGLASPAPAVAPAALPAGAPPGPAYTDEPLGAVHKIIAQRLSEAKRTIPHFYVTIDCEIDRLLAARREINADAPEGEGAYKVSVNDLVIKAVALALRRIPAVNAAWAETAIRRYSAVDVAVAVATDRGLITPIVRNADAKGLAAIAREMGDLAARARAGKLMPEEYQGGGFTVSNLGMYGVREFAAVINPPQAAILAVGAGEARPIVRDGEISIATIMSCTLSCDHRVVDGALGAEFLGVFKRLVEAPATMLA